MRPRTTISEKEYNLIVIGFYWVNISFNEMVKPIE
jgi:hypothetical protein